MNSKGLREFVEVQREMLPVIEGRFTFIGPDDIELRGNSQSLNIKVSKAAGYGVHDIVKLAPKKPGSRIVLPVRIKEIQQQQGLVDEYVNVVVVPAGDLEIPIPMTFIRELGEGVYIDGPHNYTPFIEQQLRIELGIEKTIELDIEKTIEPRMATPDDYIGGEFFAGFLDADNDGVIKKEEARKFAEGAITWIKGEGLTFSELAQGIPDGLEVNDIQVNPAPRVYESKVFNGVPRLQVRRQDIAEWLDIPIRQLQFTGTEFNSFTGEFSEVDLKRTLEDARNEFKELVPPRRIQAGEAEPGDAQAGDAEPGDAEIAGVRWYRPPCYISVIDKKEGDLLMSGRKVETIKKIKKCGKCFYRIMLTDDRVVSGIRSGDCGECIFKMTMLQPVDQLVDQLQGPIGCGAGKPV